MGKIYTSYFANWRNFPEGSLKIGITRFAPSYWQHEINIEKLAPSESLLRSYQNKQIDKYMFAIEYRHQLRERGLTPEGVRTILDGVANGRDIVLCCYEKPEDFCHRHVLAEWLGEDVEEL